MSKPVKTAYDTTMPIVGLVPLMFDIGLHRVSIVDPERRLVGAVTQIDPIAATHQTSLAQL